MLERLPRIGPRAYARVTTVAFVLLMLIVFTGAAVRLTGSGLGCPTWPKCHGHLLTTKLDYHGAVEYGNRLITGLVGVGAIAAALLAFRRRPFRRDLAWLGLALPLGVIAQAVLGGLTVLHHLAPGYVMGHFLLSLTVLAAAFALMWRARSDDDTRETPVEDRRTVLAVRAILPVAIWVLILGTIATGSGPHPGTHGDEIAKRFTFHGGNTMDWTIHWHGRFSTFFGLCAVALWFYLRRQQAGPRLRRAATALCLGIATQGVIGFVQYENHLPTAIVWFHVCVATLTWVSALWTVAAAGRLAPARERADERLTAPA